MSIKCKDCSDKYEGCHDRCPSFIAITLARMDRYPPDTYSEYMEYARDNKTKHIKEKRRKKR